jgi:NAD(P)-dependent dehydrogenase (short-subunit alcohol dehydrogenase family)
MARGLALFGASYAPAYGASKGGVVQLTQSLAVAWAAFLAGRGSDFITGVAIPVDGGYSSLG